jgi:single-stranded DNA-specific DHH superfamily exonuclease
MLTPQQIIEIREHLEKAQNPLFFFDSDNDGLCSFLLLRRFIKTGKGVAVKGAHYLNLNYYRKIQELKPDYIFILDIPLADEKFLDKIKQDNLPIVWIDHHDVEKPKDKEISYYNPYHNDKTNEPVSYLCYKITNNKQDIWIAVIGSITDCYMPDFYPEFEKKYPELSKKNIKAPFDLLYNSQLGEIAKILDFSLKDRTTNVVKMMKFMIKATGPMDILEENFHTKQFLQHAKEIDSKYKKLIEKARKSIKGNLIYFEYAGDLSLSSNLASQLSYEFPDKIIVVIYNKGDSVNISLRGKEVDIKKILLKAIEGLESARGGGHEHACGAIMSTDDLKKFEKRIKQMVEKLKI